MRSINRITIGGYLGKDAELKTMSTGSKKLELNVSTSK
jgi:single-stranded DNA-binding protein